MLNNDMALIEVIEVCRALEDADISSACYIEGHGESFDWTGTLHQMQEDLGRKCTQGEVTALSLSRNFGPVPAIPDNDQEEVLFQCWPRGNPRGWRHSWGDLAAKLAGLTAK